MVENEYLASNCSSLYHSLTKFCMGQQMANKIKSQLKSANSLNIKMENIAVNEILEAF